MQNTALHCPTLHSHCTALHFAALNCTALHWNALHCTALHFTPLWCIELHYTALHCNTIKYNALQCNAMPYTALHVWYCTALHCTLLHCTTLHCPALQCTALQCNALHLSGSSNCQHCAILLVDGTCSRLTAVPWWSIIYGTLHLTGQGNTASKQLISFLGGNFTELKEQEEEVYSGIRRN